MNMKSILQGCRQQRYTVPRNCLLRRRYHELSYSSHGEPADVLSYKSDLSITDDDPPDSPNNLIKVEMFHVPWNPADVNTVQGKYPYPAPYKKPNTTSRYFDKDSVLGSEGWGRVVVSSSTDNSIPEGSLVTMGMPGLGTLRSSMWVSESSVIRVPETILDKLGPAGSTLFQLGGTAWRMLQDFVPDNLASPGEVVLQNAGNSGVGLMTSQLATALLGLTVVSVIRRGSKTEEEFNELVHYLKTVGKNALVVADEDLQDPANMKSFQSQLRELSGSGKLPSLALNAVGGKSAKALMKSLETGGTMVTYGGMSAEPVVVATPQLIFKDIRIVGYWHSRWMLAHSLPDKQRMVDELVRAVMDHGVQCPPVEVFPLQDVQHALDWQSNQKGIRSKLVWNCQEHER
jgi:trans-2-enoyl-CoA reductase